MNTRRKDNLTIHPRLDRGRAALQDRLAGQFRMLAEQLAEDRLAAIAAIEHALANLERYRSDAPAGMTNKLIGHFRLALSEIEAIDPTCEPEPGVFEEIARRLERLTELPRAYLVLSRMDPLEE